MKDLLYFLAIFFALFLIAEGTHRSLDLAFPAAAQACDCVPNCECDNCVCGLVDAGRNGPVYVAAIEHLERRIDDINDVQFQDFRASIGDMDRRIEDFEKIRGRLELIEDAAAKILDQQSAANAS